MKQKGMTPVIATVVLISLGLVLASIIFLWSRGFVEKGAIYGGEPIERACERVSFEAGVFRNTQGAYELEVNNRGNIPLYGFAVRVLGNGKVRVQEIVGQNVGEGKSQSIALNPRYFPEIYGENRIDLVFVPILQGYRGGKSVSYTCGDSYGVEAVANG